ncbi:MAG: DUF6282 family protein [Spirochaetota bacterium]
MSVETKEVELKGLIDMHIHTAPDIIPRSLDDVQAATQAAEAGMEAIVLKSHVNCTADRAGMAQKIVPGIKVFGGLVLNAAVGGLNPTAVEAALALGARIIWMPTLSAQNHREKNGEARPGIGIKLFTPEGELRPELFEIFDLVKTAEAILATGHVSVAESIAIVRKSREVGVKKVIVTHPEVSWIAMSTDLQMVLRDLGTYFERCYVSCLSQGGGIPISRLASDIRRVGVESTVLSTDFGVSTLPAPLKGLESYIQELLSQGFSEEEIWMMLGENPARLLGIR